MIATIWHFILEHWIALTGGAAVTAGIGAALAAAGPAAVLAFLGKVPRWCWEVLILLLALWLFGAHERNVGAADVQAKWDAEKVVQSDALKKADQQVKDAQDALTKGLKEAKDENDKQIAAIAADRDDALKRLRNRPNRRPTATAAGAGTSGVCAGASGAELSKEDAAFLVGEAARADSVVAELNMCNSKYDAVADALSELQQSQAAPRP